jgi:hypothetical protein
MAKAVPKNTSKVRRRQHRRKRVALTAPNYSLGSPEFATPALGQDHRLHTYNWTLGADRPGDSPAERATRNYLRHLMMSAARPPRKDDVEAEVKARFGASGRGFARIWAETVAETGARAFSDPGPRGRRTQR